jgi:hypothetical protein
MNGMPIADRARRSGNGLILGVERADGGWLVRFAPEPRTSPQPLWFHVEVRGLAGAPVTFCWENPDITLGDSSRLDTLRPVLRADAAPPERVTQTRVETLPDGRRRILFAHAGGADSVAASLCYPYGPEDLETTLADLGGAWGRSPLGVTGRGRELARLRFHSAAGARRPGLFLLARQHAGETPGSWVLDGILRFLASDEPEAREIRSTVDVWAAPFVDLDGVVDGDYGKDAFPWDFNRAWEQLPQRPEVQALQCDLLRFAALTEPRLVIDLHAPGHSAPDLYVQLPREQRPVHQQQAAMRFAELMAEHFPELNPAGLSRPTRYPSRWNALSTLGSWLWDYLERTPEVTIETSYQSLAGRPLDPDGYRAIGRRVALTAWAWLRERPQA